MQTMSPKLLVVFGASGQQGGSVISYVLNDPELSKEYNIRAVTRNTQNQKIIEFEKRGAEIVQADLTDEASLNAACSGAFMVFGMTISIYEEDGRKREIDQGKALVDAAVNAGAEYFLWSSGLNVTNVTGANITNAYGFESKAIVEEYIKSLNIKGIYYIPGCFMQNFRYFILKPEEETDKQYVISSVFNNDTYLPLIDVEKDSGKFIGPILRQPQKYVNFEICAAQGLYTLDDIARRLSVSTGYDIVYRQVNGEDLVKKFPQPMQKYGSAMVELVTFFRDYGYYGPDMEQKVAWAVKQVGEPLTTIEEFIADNPYDF